MGSDYRYAVVDGVMRQTAIKDAYKIKGAIQVIPLYMNTRFQENYDLGPLLIATSDNDSSYLVNTITQQWSDSASIIHSNESPLVIAEHLKQFITVTDDSGSNALLRFADPLITWYWLQSYQQSALPDIMGAITQWQIPMPHADWDQQPRQWLTIENPKTERLKFQVNYLSSEQVTALDQAAKFRFKNKLYHSLKVKPNSPFQQNTATQIGQWLDEILTSAQTNYLTTERSIAIWADLVMDHGVDFLNQPAGDYQRWLAKNKQYAPLPIDIKVEQFYRAFNQL